MKKLFVIMAIVLMATSAQAWTISWDALSTPPDRYEIRYKAYPAGYGDQTGNCRIEDGVNVCDVLNPAPIEDIQGGTFIVYDNGAATELANIETVFNLELEQRYVFYVAGIRSGGEVLTDHFSWTYPDLTREQQVIEIPVRKVEEAEITIKFTR